jgi:uncharacterized protein GlcG (DUF336 family)
MIKLAYAVIMAAMLVFGQPAFAWLMQAGPEPSISSQGAIYEPATGRLIIRGENFRPGASVFLFGPSAAISHGPIKVKGSKKIIVSDVVEADLADGVEAVVSNSDGTSSQRTPLKITLSDDSRLTEADVKTIISQAVAQAEAIGLKAVIAVVDSEGNVLAVFAMDGAPSFVDPGVTSIGKRIGCQGQRFPDCGLESDDINRVVPACAAAISKAVTGSFLSSQGHAFSTRTASFIVQEHFPPGVDFQPSGPLFGVQFSQLLCSDVNPRSPLGLSADPGGIPLYKNGIKVGGLGIEGDGKYALDPDPRDLDVPPEEIVAVAASRGFEAPEQIRGDKIIVNGIRFPYVNAQMPPAVSTQPFERLRGTLINCAGLAPTAVRGAQPSRFRVVTLDPSIPAGRVDARFFPFKSGSLLTAAEVRQIIVQAAFQAFLTRAAIRQPENSSAEVNITVCDADGSILGIFSTIDAPIFGFDVSAQKARTAAFFSNPTAGAQLRGAGFSRYVDAAARDGLMLDGKIAFSSRAQGFLSRPFFPDGINNTENGPFSVPIGNFSPFNDGLQLDLLAVEYFGNLLAGIAGNNAALANALSPPCPSIAAVANGIQIFPGSVPLYKNGQLAGAIGISGDGVDQDDIIAHKGSAGFESPPEIRSDRVFVRGVRLPFTKFPRHPNRG